MFKKLNISINIIILVIFGMAVIAFIISAIVGLFEKEELIDIDNINKYIITQDVSDESGNVTSKSNIVTDYSTFYTLQDASENFIQYLVDKKYSQTYNILSEELKNKYTKTEYEEKIKEMSKKNFEVDLNTNNLNNGQDNGINSFNNSDNLVKLYQISDTEYLCESKSLYSQTFKLGLIIDPDNNTYKVFYIEF